MMFNITQLYIAYRHCGFNATLEGEVCPFYDTHYSILYRCDETPHRVHRTASRREWWVTGHFAPSSVRPIGRIQRFLDVSCLFS